MIPHHVRHFLDFFGQKKGASDKVTNTYCWMDANTSSVIKGRGTVFGTFKDIAKWEKEIVSSGIKLPTLHITLNETKPTGRKRGDIASSRVICCDIDRKITKEELLKLYKKYKVQMVVQSSTGKYHLYWQLERGIDLEVWRKIQLGIASKIDGDLQLSLPTSMIRVPGFTRISKDGVKQVSSVMAFADENKVWPIPVKKLIKMWPWIWEESGKGEETLKKQRSTAAKIARDLIKARGKDYDSSKFARMTPDAGRNNTLYLSVYDIVYSHDSKLNEEEALSFGMDINSAFSAPLSDFEVAKTVHSAWAHGRRARKKKVRKTLKVLDALGKTGVSGECKSKEDKSAKEAKAAKKALEAGISATIVDLLAGPSQNRPESYLDISDILVDRLWTSGGISGSKKVLHHNILASAYKTKYFKKLTDFMVNTLKSTGSYKVSGYGVYLRGSNAEHDAVRHRDRLDIESLSSLVQDIYNRLYLFAVRESLNGHREADGKQLLEHLEKNNDT